MGGYGFYVWGAYLVALVTIGGEVLILARRRKSLERRKGAASSLRGNHNK